MRIVSCVVLGLSLCMVAPVFAAGSPGPRFFVRPPARILHVGPGTVRPGYRNGHYNYATGFYGPWGWPGVYGEGAGAPAQSQVFAPTSNVWYGPRPVGQGDIGYVTHPAIYNVQRELSRGSSFAPGPTK